MSEYEVFDFGVGDVLAQGLGVFARKFVSFYALGLIFTFMLSLLGMLLEVGDASVEGEGTPALVLFIAPLMIMLSVLLFAAITYGTYREMRGQQAGPGECVAQGLRCVFPVLGVVLLCYLVIGLGFGLLIIPGLILLTMLWTAIPVAVIERPGVIASLARSRELTRGYRLPILGIILAVTLLPGLILAPLQQLEWLPVELLLAFIAIAWLLLWAVMPAVSYVHLRSVKEGVAINEIAAVFD